MRLTYAFWSRALRKLSLPQLAFDKRSLRLNAYKLTDDQIALLARIANGGTLKCHRYIDGVKVYRLHLLDGTVEMPSAKVVDQLKRGHHIDSNKKFPAATYLLTDKGRQAVLAVTQEDLTSDFQQPETTNIHTEQEDEAIAYFRRLLEEQERLNPELVNDKFLNSMTYDEYFALSEEEQDAVWDKIWAEGEVDIEDVMEIDVLIRGD